MKVLFHASERTHGAGKVQFAWNPKGTFLASCGTNGQIVVHDRHGKIVHQAPLSMRGACKQIEWSFDGSAIALCQHGVQSIAVLEVASRVLNSISNTAVGEPTVMAWSLDQPILAAGDGSGNLLLYNMRVRRTIPVVGKHTGAILSATWSMDGRIALGGEDCMVTVSSSEGDTKDSAELNTAPVQIAFARQKTDTPSAARKATTLTVNMGRASILLMDMAEHADKPFELTFQDRYGPIEQFTWFGDGYLALGFRGGFVTVISTHKRELGSEIFTTPLQRDPVKHAAVSDKLMQLAVAGGSTVRLLDLQAALVSKAAPPDRVALRLEAHMGTVEGLEWTQDGQILTVSTSAGSLISLLGDLPSLATRNGNRFALLSSLREASVVDTAAGDARLRVPLEVEPQLLTLGPNHVLAGMNSRAWIYRLRISSDGTAGAAVSKKEFAGDIAAVALGPTHCAVICGGRVLVHVIEEAGEAASTATGGAPINEGEDDAVCVAAVGELLMWGTSSGSVHFWHCPTGKRLDGARFEHPEASGSAPSLAAASAAAGSGGTGAAIRSIYPNQAGTRLVIVDGAHRSWLYSPVDNLSLRVAGAPEPPSDVLWDAADWGLFCMCSGSRLGSFQLRPLTVYGPTIDRLGHAIVAASGSLEAEATDSDIPDGNSAVLVKDGVLTSRAGDGSVTRTRLVTHSHLEKAALSTPEGTAVACRQAMQLGRLTAAWELAARIRDRTLLLALANRAKTNLQPAIAIRVYRALGDAGMVMSLEAVQAVEDAQALAGHMAVMFADYDRAEQCFLRSNTPKEALQLRRDLLQWEAALRLARAMAPEEVGGISIECAKQLEVKGETDKALATYEEAERELPPDDTLPGAPPSSAVGLLHQRVRGGLARTLLKTGDIRRGLELAREGDASLARECGTILEGLRQTSEAAELFMKANDFERAANILLQARNFEAAGAIMDKVSSPMLLVAYAKAEEQAGRYDKAVVAFKRAKATDDVVRVYLERMDRLDEAAALARETRSTAAATMVAAHMADLDDTRGAIEFQLLAGRPDEAFELAASSSNMDIYTEVIAKAMGGEVPDDEYLRIARYFEDKGDHAQAGKYFASAAHYHRALSHFLHPSNGDSCLDDAVEVVGKSRQEQLVDTLLDHITGETDGVPKGDQYIFKINMALGRYENAAAAAVTIAKAQREDGNYRMAHGVLFEMHRELVKKNVRIPQVLQATLEQLHGYLLARRLVKLGDHEGAARLLLQCAEDLSRFPSNATALLTTTVVECHRSGLKRSASSYARVLMDAEHRDSIDPKLKRKIEALVRRPATSEKEEETAPCPVCSYDLGAWQADCPSCKSHIPTCVVTGRHMTLSDWSACPRCNWPALFSHLGHMVETEPSCPMCEQTVARGTPRLAREPVSELARLMGQTGKHSGAAAGAAGEEGEGAAAAGTGGGAEAAATAAASAAPARSGAAMAALGALGLS